MVTEYICLFSLKTWSANCLFVCFCQFYTCQMQYRIYSAKKCIIKCKIDKERVEIHVCMNVNRLPLLVSIYIMEVLHCSVPTVGARYNKRDCSGPGPYLMPTATRGPDEPQKKAKRISLIKNITYINIDLIINNLLWGEL